MYFRRARNASLGLGALPDAGTLPAICVKPSCIHASINVRFAVSPLPNKAVTAESDKGSVYDRSPGGRESTERARASRVKPWLLTNGRASLRSCVLAVVLREAPFKRLPYVPCWCHSESKRKSEKVKSILVRPSVLSAGYTTQGVLTSGFGKVRK